MYIAKSEWRNLIRRLKQRIKKLSKASLENLLLDVTGDYYGEYCRWYDIEVKGYYQDKSIMETIYQIVI